MGIIFVFCAISQPSGRVTTNIKDLTILVNIHCEKAVKRQNTFSNTYTKELSQEKQASLKKCKAIICVVVFHSSKQDKKASSCLCIL